MLIVCILCASSVSKIYLSTQNAHKMHTSSSPMLRFSLPENNLFLPDDDFFTINRKKKFPAFIPGGATKDVLVRMLDDAPG